MKITILSLAIITLLAFASTKNQLSKTFSFYSTLNFFTKTFPFYLFIRKKRHRWRNF